MTNKFHDLYHLAQRSCDVNPAMGSCMQQEDLMGKVKSLVQKCVQGAKPLASITKTMTKYRLGLQLEHGRASWGVKISLVCNWRVFWESREFFSLVLTLTYLLLARSFGKMDDCSISYIKQLFGIIARFYFFCQRLCFDLSYAVDQAFLFWDDRDRPERHRDLPTAGVGRFTPKITWRCSVPVRAQEWNNDEVPWSGMVQSVAHIDACPGLSICPGLVHALRRTYGPRI